MRKKKYGTKKILVAGGYGYGNVGDEAQCSATLDILTKRYPQYQIVNLTPDIEYSKTQHPNYQHDFASRVLFFNQNRKGNCFELKNKKRKIKFILKSILILINALLAKHNLPTFFINVETAKFIYELKEAELFYYCGGGFLTGSTQSRLWDGIVTCKLCEIFNTPVVMSGQTIGVWNNNFNKILAKWGFKKVKIITTRDEEYSTNDLKKIGLEGENYFPTHDDALFCAKSENKQLDVDNYISFNFHYWGMKEEEKKIYIDKINKIINYLMENTNYNFVFIPMHATDKKSFEDYIQKYPNDRFKCFDYDFDFKKVRRVIADSKICITMKHHPIIFAMGENIPTISLAFSDYYIHKNVGALAQYKMENFSINFESGNYFDEFSKLFNEIKNNSEKIKGIIYERKEILKMRKEKFLKLCDEILEN